MSELKTIINYQNYDVTLNINLDEKTLVDGISNVDAMRYLKGVFTNKARFQSRFVDKVLSANRIYEEMRNDGDLEKFDHVIENRFECSEFMEELLDLYDHVEPFTYLEAFKLDNAQFQSSVFGSIDITEMINSLGNERIKADGKLVKHKQFDVEGNFTGYKEYNNIYETYRVFGKGLNLDEDLYAIKCWCTSTDKAHWLWIDDTHKDNPLEAIASTFRIHENLIPHIQELKRQGDILLVEMKEGVDEIEPEGQIVGLTADQYFELLTAQS